MLCDCYGIACGCAPQVVNSGKYQVGYKFLLRKPPTRDVITLTPSEGTLEPDSRGKVDVLLKTAQELSLKDNHDIRVQFTELLTGEVIQELTMPVKVQGHLLLTTYYLDLLLTTHYSLLTPHYSLLTTHYSLLTTHSSLLTPHYSLLTTHY